MGKSEEIMQMTILHLPQSSTPRTGRSRGHVIFRFPSEMHVNRWRFRPMWYLKKKKIKLLNALEPEHSSDTECFLCTNSTPIYTLYRKEICLLEPHQYAFLHGTGIRFPASKFFRFLNTESTDSSNCASWEGYSLSDELIQYHFT